jgi:hypothetical protein
MVDIIRTKPELMEKIVTEIEEKEYQPDMDIVYPVYLNPNVQNGLSIVCVYDATFVFNSD